MIKTNNPSFKVSLPLEGKYYRLYITHPYLKGRFKKRIGTSRPEDLERIQLLLKYELQKYFETTEITREAVDKFINDFISMQVKHSASIFDYFQEFISSKQATTNKKTKKTLAKPTITSYFTAKKYFELYLAKEKISSHPAMISKNVLNGFYSYLPGEHNYRVKLHTKIKGFLKYLETEKRLPIDTSYKLSSFNEEYDNQDPKGNDIALTEKDVYKLLALRERFKRGEVNMERYSKSEKIPENLQEHQFNIKVENIIKCLDCFLFMLSTGMYYADIMKSTININSNGSIAHINYRRAKNGSLCKAIPIKNNGVFIAEDIIKQYDIKSGKNFPLSLSLTHFDKHLERISKLAELNFKITNKMARKTFASLLYFNPVHSMPLHFLQLMLGHQDVKDTVHYLRIKDDAVAGEIGRIMFARNEI